MAGGFFAFIVIEFFNFYGLSNISGGFENY